VDQLVEADHHEKTMPILFRPELGSRSAGDVIGRKVQRSVYDCECDGQHPAEQDYGHDKKRCGLGRDVQRKRVQAFILV
jgi:hypothetical protein